MVCGWQSVAERKGCVCGDRLYHFAEHRPIVKVESASDAIANASASTPTQFPEAAASNILRLSTMDRAGYRQCGLHSSVEG